MSSPVTVGIAKSQFFNRIIDKLTNSTKAVVRLNLLRILRTVCDVHPNRAMLVERFGIYDIVRRLSKHDGAVLVRELAREIMPTLAPALKPLSSRAGKGPDTPKSAIAPKKKMRRAASESAAAVVPTFTGSQVRQTLRNATGGSGSRLPRQSHSEAPQQAGGHS
ncbi:hypothetical protein PHLCEN_2v6716 [Hermanssonia centrifuga]|uniref:Uncharacterized protein n=1 Tax=Hermanssonia centrifuga TaxID=98765 RepID=A0A2R6NYK7_9APHY|nr:hypothetical protein PHLCEN_2v6716 [Hermanssonia centrifuga]